MDTLELSNPRAGWRATRWLAASLLCLGSGACADLEPREDLSTDVDRIAERLVQSARERADLRQLRVWVAEIRETRPKTTRASATGDDLIGLQLEHELVIALATRLNVVESELLEPTQDTPAKNVLGESAAARGATHVLVGDYVRQRDVLQITVRLIDANSRLIVAAARGEVKLSQVGTMGFDRWTRSAATLEPPSEPPARVVQLGPSTKMSAASEPPPATASIKVQSSTLQPPPFHQPAPAAAKEQPKPAVKPSVPAATAPPAVEDFESWRQRHQAELEQNASNTITALDQAARDRVAPAVKARRDELANKPEEQEEFPWRKNPWLAHLLGIPETPKSAQR
jgi:TolB-like protein